MDAVNIEEVKFESLLLNKKEFRNKYDLNVNASDFGIDPDTGLAFMNYDIVCDCKNDPEVQRLLDCELETLKDDQVSLRCIMANREMGRESVPMSYAPVNIQRVIANATKQFRIDHSQPSELHPKDIITKVNCCIKRLLTVNECDDILIEVQQNATMAFQILIRSILASKRVLLEYRLTAISLDWILSHIATKFFSSKVHPGESVGILAAQSISQPTTQMTLNVSRYVFMFCFILLLLLFFWFYNTLLPYFYLDVSLCWSFYEECYFGSSSIEGASKCYDSSKDTANVCLS